MLAKKNRLTQAQFAHFFKTGKRFQTKTATLIFTPHPTFHGAVVVSKKVSKKAVDRNTLRRRVYAQLYQAKTTKPTGVYIVVVKPPLKTLGRTHQHQAIQGLIEQVK
jgi:ribonuclease P protein component